MDELFDENTALKVVEKLIAETPNLAIEVLDAFQPFQLTPPAAPVSPQTTKILSKIGRVVPVEINIGSGRAEAQIEVILGEKCATADLTEGVDGVPGFHIIRSAMIESI